MTTTLKDSNPFSVLASTASASGVTVAPSPAVDDVDVNVNITPPSTSISDDAPDIEQEEDPEPEQPEQAKDVEDPFAQEQSKKDDVDDNMMESQKTSSLMHSLTRDKAADAAEGVKPFVYLVAVTAALGGLIFGYDIGGAGELYVWNSISTVYTIAHHIHIFLFYI